MSRKHDLELYINLPTGGTSIRRKFRRGDAALLRKVFDLLAENYQGTDDVFIGYTDYTLIEEAAKHKEEEMALQEALNKDNNVIALAFKRAKESKIQRE